MSGRRSPSLRTLLGSLRPRSQRTLRVLAALSAFMLLVSGLSLSALTAGIEIAEDQRPAIGPPEHRFGDDGEDLPAGAPSRRGGIPRAAFERVNPSCPPPVSSSQARIVAAGGDEVVDVVVDGITYRQHRFTSVASGGTFTVSEATPTARIEVLVVGGGGGGGKRHGGGGGAGGLVLATVPVSAGQSFDVVVGSGGDGGGPGAAPSAAKNGEPSSFGEGPLRLLAKGGGRGASFNSEDDDTAGAGGSGGGARSVSSGTTNGASTTQGSVTNRCSTFNLGHPGGAASGQWPGGGGGGAGGPGGAGTGTSASPGTTQTGGDGLDLSDRFGTGVGDGGWFAGGGGGAPAESGTRAGGKGGGGEGKGPDVAGEDGRDGTGGGGGGARSSTAGHGGTGGSGGSGIVIVRYPLVPSAVRDVIAGEGETTAVIRWRVPETNAPTEPDSYRVERRAVGGTDTEWVTVPTEAGDFAQTGADADRFVTVELGEIPNAPHEFRISPLGSADGPSAILGPSTIVTPVAKGGDTVTLIDDDVVHAFTSPGNSSFQLSEARSLRYLVVGGGGGGGSRHGGGGGAGGVVTNSDGPLGLEVAAGAHTFTIGAGGAGAPAGSNTIASKGEDSSAFGMTALGGGAGSSLSTFDAAQNGGSGGGARGNFAYQGGSGTPGQGFAGGAVPRTGGRMRGGGGGGATAEGAAGQDGTGDGGAGRDLSATFGTMFGVGGVFGGGGGGSGDSADGGAQSIGGTGGGGRGGRGSSSPGEAGVDGSGGGGGGGGHAGATNYEGHQGGSGTVIVRYAFLDSGVQGGVFAEAATTAVLRWEDPADGADSITGYRVERSTDGITWVTVDAAQTVSGTVRTVALSGLPSATARRFRVTALHDQRSGSVTSLKLVGRGGTSVTLVGGDVVHRYETTGTHAFEMGRTRPLDVMILGGGGGGGADSGSGGGGGALLEGRITFADESDRTGSVTVGNAGTPTSWSTGAWATRGGQSTLTISAPSGQQF